jgi:hypothetical protein
MKLVNDLIPAQLWPTKTKNPVQPGCRNGITFSPLLAELLMRSQAVGQISA